MEPVGYRPLLQRSQSASDIRHVHEPLRRTQSVSNLRSEHAAQDASITPATMQAESIALQLERFEPSLLDRAHTTLVNYINPSAHRAPYYTRNELTLHRFIQIGFAMSFIRSTSSQARAFYRAIGLPLRFQFRAVLDEQHSLASYMNMAFLGARLALDRRIDMRIASLRRSAYDIPVPARANT